SDELQLFVNIYPESERAEEDAELIQDLRDKPEKKAFDNAKLYYDMGKADDYRAAVIAFENVLKTYPDAKYAEEIEFLMTKSQYLYADNSYPNRQEERFNQAITYYNQFVAQYPDSKFRSEAYNLRGSAEKTIVVAIRRMEEIKIVLEEQGRELGVTTSEDLAASSSAQ